MQSPPNHNQNKLFVNITKLILKKTGKRPRILNAILKENGVEKLTFPDLKIYYKVTIIKIV